jgi:hypothetical protein
MVKKHIVITDDGPEVLQENDRVVSIYPGSQPDEGPHVVVEREFPDEPAHKPGTAGIATVENNYGVAMPNQSGVWVSRGEGPQFILFATKAGRRAMYPASMVSDFVPDPTMPEVFESLCKDVRTATLEASTWRRRFESADRGLRDLVSDTRRIQSPTWHAGGMKTAAGATLARWLRRLYDEMEEEGA